MKSEPAAKKLKTAAPTTMEVGTNTDNIDPGHMDFVSAYFMVNMYAADKDGFIRILMVILESLTKGADDKTYRHTGNSLCHIMQLLNPEQQKDRDVLWVFLNATDCLDNCEDAGETTAALDAYIKELSSQWLSDADRADVAFAQSLVYYGDTWRSSPWRSVPLQFFNEDVGHSPKVLIAQAQIDVVDDMLYNWWPEWQIMGRSPELTAMCIDEMILHPLKQDKDGETGIGEGTWWDVACVMDMDETKTRRLFQTLATQYSYTRAQVAWIKRKLVSAMKGCEDHIREHPTLDHQKGTDYHRHYRRSL